MKPSRFAARFAAVACTACIATNAGFAYAQQYVPSAIAQAASGIEGGGGRAGSIGRAPTRLRFGAELHIDEEPENAVAVAGLLDLEPTTAFGMDARYIRAFDQHYAVSIGAVGYFTPGLLVGPSAAFEARARLGRTVWLTGGPEVNVFVLGTDLPDKTVLWQTLLHIGVRIDL